VTTPRYLAGVREGNPCRYGHHGLRYLSSGRCVDCAKAAASNRYAASTAARRALRAAGAPSPKKRDLASCALRNGVAVYTIADRAMTLDEWCAELGQDLAVVVARIGSGWSAFDALNRPTHARE
jgi:hypothetical protein